MKKINTLFWVITGLFGAFMLFSAVPDVMVVPEAKEFVSNKLGYPEYLIPFLGVAKILGVIAILMPGYPQVKEWAYAGLFFDLLGATYSGIMVDGFKPEMLFMVLPLTMLFLSRYYNRRRMAMKGFIHKDFAHA